jgi:phosphoglucosamine mutase
MTVKPVAEAIKAAEQQLGERGRVLVRYSGTEALARVMVEGEDRTAVETHARTIAGAVEANLGV